MAISSIRNTKLQLFKEMPTWIADLLPNSVKRNIFEVCSTPCHAVPHTQHSIIVLVGWSPNSREAILHSMTKDRTRGT